MNCKDIMVGDWVICNHYQDKLFAKQFGVADFAKGEYEFCEPIPLTEDFLLKNGWKKKPLRFFTEWYGCFQINEQNGRFFYASIPLNYVHELQHLLRLAGIEKAIEL